MRLRRLLLALALLMLGGLLFPASPAPAAPAVCGMHHHCLTVTMHPPTVERLATMERNRGIPPTALVAMTDRRGHGEVWVDVTFAWD